MDKVFEKTRELGEALLESDAYKRMKAAEEKAMRNSQAAEMMSAYLEKRGAIQELMEADEMDNLHEKLQLVDDIAELTQARSDFNGLIGQINQVLQFIVTGRMDDGSECSGSCESCRGCH